MIGAALPTSCVEFFIVEPLPVVQHTINSYNTVLNMEHVPYADKLIGHQPQYTYITKGVAGHQFTQIADFSEDPIMNDQTIITYIADKISMEFKCLINIISMASCSRGHTNGNTFRTFVYHLTQLSRHVSNLKWKFNKVDDLVTSGTIIKLASNKPDDFDQVPPDHPIFTEVLVGLIIRSILEYVWLRRYGSFISDYTDLHESMKTFDYKSIGLRIKSNTELIEVIKTHTLDTLFKSKTGKQLYLFFKTIEPKQDYKVEIALENTTSMPNDVFIYIMKLLIMNQRSHPYKTIDIGVCIDTCHWVCSHNKFIDREKITGIQGQPTRRDTVARRLTQLNEFIRDIQTKVFLIHLNNTNQQIGSGRDAHTWWFDAENADRPQTEMYMVAREYFTQQTPNVSEFERRRMFAKIVRSGGVLLRNIKTALFEEFLSLIREIPSVIEPPSTDSDYINPELFSIFVKKSLHVLSN